MLHNMFSFMVVTPSIDLISVCYHWPWLIIFTTVCGVKTCLCQTMVEDVHMIYREPFNLIYVLSTGYRVIFIYTLFMSTVLSGKLFTD